MFCSFLNLIHGHFRMQILNEAIDNVVITCRNYNGAITDFVEIKM